MTNTIVPTMVTKRRHSLAFKILGIAIEHVTKPHHKQNSLSSKTCILLKSIYKCKSARFTKLLMKYLNFWIYPFFCT